MPTQDYKTQAGKPVPGVTTVIGAGLAWGKDALMEWAASMARQGKDYKEERDKAARIGTLTHARIEQALGGPLVRLEDFAPEEVKESEAPFKAFSEWHAGTDLQVTHRELAIVSEELQVGGTLDILGRLGGDVAIIDFKTSRTIHPAHIVQVAGYRELAKEFLGYRTPIARCCLLHIPRGCRRAKLLTVSDEALEHGASVFRALLRIYQAEKRLTVKAATTNGGSE